MWTAGGFDGNCSEAVRAFFCGGVSRWRSFLHLIRGANNEEDDEGDDEEVYDGLDEHAPFDLCRTDGEGEFAEIDPAHEQTNERHENVIDE